MIAFGFIISFIFAIFGIKTERKLFNPLTVFCGLWCLIIFLSSLHLYGLYEANNTTYFWIDLGVVSFVFGYYVIKASLHNKTIVFKKINSSKIKYYTNYRKLYLIFTICLLFCLKDFITVISRIGLGNDLKTVQVLLQSNDDVFTRSSIENAIKLLFVNPMLWTMGPIVITDFWIGKKDKILLSLMVAISFLRISTTGGRAALIQIVFCFISIYTIVSNKRNSTKRFSAMQNIRKNKRKFILLASLGIFLLAFMTYSRAGQSAIKTLYGNFAMQPIMLQTWAHEAQNSPLGFGRASLNGILYTIEYVLRNSIHLSFSSTFQEITNLIMATDTEWQWIGETLRANAYVSVFWFFYVDARIPGIVIGSFLYGGLSKLSFNKLIKNMSVRNVAIYSLFLLGVFYTFGRCQYSQIDFTLGMVYLCFFIYKRENVNYIKG